LILLGRLPEGKLKPLFNDTQWKVVNRQLEQFKGLEPRLKELGLVLDEGDVASDAQPAARKE
jgi:hypothetical protein